MKTEMIVISDASEDVKAIITETEFGKEYLIIHVFYNDEQKGAHLTCLDVSLKSVQCVLSGYAREYVV
jgi:hypothetical protein